MKDLELPEHGGDINFFAKHLGLSPSQIIDLSSSVNPLVKKFLSFDREKLLEVVTTYPDPDCKELKKNIAQKYCLKEDFILIGNGSYELLNLLLLNLPSGIKIFIPEPTFVGYRKILSLRKDLILEIHISLYPEEHLLALENFIKATSLPKAVILCNPNNPTGLTFEKKTLLNMIRTYPDVLFIVDEAFIEFDEGNTLINEVSENLNLFVLRSFTKFFGLAGTRVGFLASSNALLRQIETLKPTWSVNTLSQYFAKIVLRDETFKKESLNYFHKLKNLFEAQLDELSIEFLKSKTNFYLLRNLPKGDEFFWWILKKKYILVRNCYNFCGLTRNDLRISLKDEKSLNLFIEALREWLRVL